MSVDKISVEYTKKAVFWYIVLLGQLIFACGSATCSAFMYGSIVPFIACFGMILGPMIVVDAIVFLNLDHY